MSTVQSTNPHRYEYDPESGVVYCKLDFLGFPGYRVGDDGSVWSCRKLGHQVRIGDSWRRIYGSIGKHGHHYVKLGTGSKCLLIHRLVLEVFVGPCPQGMECCHSPDPRPSNNAVTNLRWATHADNMHDAVIHGTIARGERSNFAKLTAGIVKKIRLEIASGATKNEIMVRHTISRRTYRRIVVNDGKPGSWSHIC